ncbi:MAG: HPr(Ser) kinase/phosphatase [Clostridia bacterium]|nr:HPr(Ser) kinase/phosphatase [Clostridia bacterium]
MQKEYSVLLDKIIDEHTLERVYMPQDAAERVVECADVNRPGLALSGYFEYFDKNRIQVMGKSEFSFLEGLDAEVRRTRLEQLTAYQPPAVVISRGLDILPELREACEKYQVPLLRTTDTTSAFISSLIAFLNVQLAPRITRHGVFVEVYGEGILLVGDSGVGKSETAIELVKRGHRLIADDAVEIRRVSSKTLVGSAPDNIRHFIELRGIGIVNARRLFGIGSVKVTEKIDMAIQLEQWNSEKAYDRMGLENQYMNILGNTVPMLTIPVKPGRNLAVIIEVAAMNNRQKKMGYNAAQELMRNLGMADDPAAISRIQKDYDLF